jgi:hypothetical protein
MYALIQTLRHSNYNAYALTFDKDLRYISSKFQHKYRISIKSIPFFIGYIASEGIQKTIFNVKKHKVLERFKASASLIGGTYGKFQADEIIIGSDEVFSTENGISKELFAIDAPYTNIVAYAASFGPTNIEDIIRKEERGYLISGLKNIRAISVRDENSKNILHEFGMEATIVCDPVILYGFKEELIDTEVKPLADYLLVYAYDNNLNQPEEVKQIKEFALTNNLRIISAGFYHKWCDCNINCTPLELLKYFENSKLVITDTFHGAVISIITKTPMIVKIRENANKLYWLLSEYNLTERITSDFSDIKNLYDLSIDFRSVEEIVAKRRTDSLNWLMSNLI